jgi:Domain of unknown function (DUF4399)
MQKLYLLLFIGTFGLISCNSSENKSTSSDTASTAKAADSVVKQSADAVKTIAELPPVPAGAKVYFKNLKNGQTVKSPFKVVMGVKNIKVDSAGMIVAGEGHHHILIDAGDSVAAGQVIPKDAQHLHFGKGQTSATISLPPGKHRLTLQLADGIHRSYGSKLSASIEVTVK